MRMENENENTDGQTTEDRRSDEWKKGNSNLHKISDLA